jgi:hypothetical protein
MMVVFSPHPNPNSFGRADRSVLSLAYQVKERAGGKLPAILSREKALPVAKQLIAKAQIKLPALHPKVEELLVKWMMSNARIAMGG